MFTFITLMSRLILNCLAGLAGFHTNIKVFLNFNATKKINFDKNFIGENDVPSPFFRYVIRRFRVLSSAFELCNPAFAKRFFIGKTGKNAIITDCKIPPDRLY